MQICDYIRNKTEKNYLKSFSCKIILFLIGYFVIVFQFFSIQ